MKDVTVVIGAGSIGQAVAHWVSAGKHDEELVGEALAPVRGQVVIATKFGFGINPDGSRYGLDSRPEHITQVARPSRRRR
jgi:aryl-alcohol dehydrogenase-like predicted oxidoreductase